MKISGLRFIVLTRRSLIAAAVCAAIVVMSAVVGVNTVSEAVATASTDKINPIYCVDTDKKVCAISFDAAWGNEQTEELLDILDEYNVKTTFFLVGDWVRKFPESVKEIDRRGHEIGNHSDTHPHMTQLSAEEKNAEIKNCSDEIEKLIGKRPALLRPPYGDYNNDVVNAVNQADMYCVQWNIDSLDWKDPSAEQIARNCTSKLEPGSIILLHNGAKNTPQALPLVLREIKSMGYKIVPIGKLIPKGRYSTDVQGKMHLCN